jgi:hypothetical protein
MELGLTSVDAATGVEDGDRHFECNCENIVVRAEYIKVCLTASMF